MKTKEYRIICHDLNDLTEEVNHLARNGWIMFKAFDPVKYDDSNGMMMRIIWEREGKQVFISLVPTDSEIETESMRHQAEYMSETFFEEGAHWMRKLLTGQ